MADAVARERTSRAVALASELVRDPAVGSRERVALCGMLGAVPGDAAPSVLSAVESDELTPAEVRRAASAALRAVRSRAQGRGAR